MVPPFSSINHLSMFNRYQFSLYNSLKPENTGTTEGIKMNIYKRIRLQHHLNIVLGFIGLVASLYIIGWVDAEHSGIIGSFSFFLCLATLIGTTVNYNSVKSKIEKIKEGDESKP